MNDIVEIDWLLEHLDEVLVLDVSPSSNKAGLSPKNEGKYIPGSIKVSLKNDFSQKDNPLPNTMLSAPDFQKSARKFGINKKSKIVVYDNLGLYSSPRMWYMLRAMGHEEVAVLNGGLDAWVETGNEYSMEVEQVNSIGDFEARFDDRFFTTANDIFTKIDDDRQLVIDARSSGRFHASVPEPRADLKGGRIPRSENIPWKELVQNGFMIGSESVMKKVEHLLDERDELVFSCGSGLTACITLLAVKQLTEIKLSVYDGSWTEWAQSDYPIEK